MLVLVLLVLLLVLLPLVLLLVLLLLLSLDFLCCIAVVATSFLPSLSCAEKGGRERAQRREQGVERHFRRGPRVGGEHDHGVRGVQRRGEGERKEKIGNGGGGGG